MKKKIILNLLLIFTCLFIFSTVKADVAGPTTATYDVIVKEVEGADFLIWNFNTDSEEVLNIPYDTQLKITSEYFDTIENVWYGYVTYGENSGRIKIEDVKLAKEVYPIEDAVKLNSKKELIVINKNGVELYNGPSKNYSKLSKTIPTGTILEYEYIDTPDRAWTYVEYEGTKGWIYTYNMAIGNNDISYVIPTSSDEVFFTISQDVVFYDYPTTESNILLEKVSAGTELKCKYSFSNWPGQTWCYTKYNETEGWVYYTYNNSLATKIDSEIMIFTDNELDFYVNPLTLESEKIRINKNSILKSSYMWTDGKYSDQYFYVNYNGKHGWLKNSFEDLNLDISYNEELKMYYGDLGISVYGSYDSNDIVDTIKNKTEFTVKFYYNDRRYVEYNNTSGWVLASDLQDCMTECENCQLTLNKTVNIYSEFDSSSEILGSINENETLKIRFVHYTSTEKWYYIEYNGIQGWINSDEEYIVDDEPEESTEEKNELIEKLESEVPKTKLEPKYIIIICVGGAIILSLTVLVIILLVNKKKSKSKNEASNNVQVVNNVESNININNQDAQINSEDKINNN